MLSSDWSRSKQTSFSTVNSGFVGSLDAMLAGSSFAEPNLVLKSCLLRETLARLILWQVVISHKTAIMRLEAQKPQDSLG